jgi:hypothetical protein
MTDQEKIALKAACVQAAATIVEGQSPSQTIAGKQDNAPGCATMAKNIYYHLTGQQWEATR